MTLVFGLEGQEGGKVAANILYGFDCNVNINLKSSAKNKIKTHLGYVSICKLNYKDRMLLKKSGTL